MAALVESEFAGYHVERAIGRGGMGVVYRAIDLRLERPVALKVLPPELTDDAGFRRRFEQESKLAASLDHPNVIPIHAAGEHDGVLYIAMRFVEGEDLRTVLRAEGRLPPLRATRLLSQVAAALDAAHARGLVHRDVKPGNVLVTPEDHVYLTDFGLSKRLSDDSQATRTGAVLGTFDYLAPEQIRSETIGPFTDVYALGCLAVHLLTGQVPFPVPTEEGKLWAQLSEPPPRPYDRVPELGRAFDAELAKAMSKKPTIRHRSAGQLAAALAAAAAPAPAPPPAADPLLHPARPPAPAPAPAPKPAPPRSASQRHVLALALSEPFNLVVLAALLAVGAAVGTIGLMVPLALLVYAAGVVRSYRDPDTRARAERSRGRPR